MNVTVSNIPISQLKDNAKVSASDSNSRTDSSSSDFESDNSSSTDVLVKSVPINYEIEFKKKELEPQARDENFAQLKIGMSQYYTQKNKNHPLSSEFFGQPSMARAFALNHIDRELTDQEQFDYEQLLKYYPKLRERFEAKVYKIDQSINHAIKVLNCFTAEVDNLSLIDKQLEFINLTIPQFHLNLQLTNIKDKMATIIVDRSGALRYRGNFYDREIKQIKGYVKEFEYNIRNWKTSYASVLIKEIITLSNPQLTAPFNNQELYQKIINNKTNIDFLTVKNLVNDKKFDQAIKIIDEYHKIYLDDDKNREYCDFASTRAQRNYFNLERLYNNEFNKYYDNHGVEHRFANDSEYHQIKPSLKVKWPPVPNNEINQTLDHKLNSQIHDIPLLAQEYQKFSASFKAVPQEIMRNRLEGFASHMQNDFTLNTKQYNLSLPVQELLKINNISPELYQNFNGSDLQHRLHSECITIIEHIARDNIKPLNKIIINFVEVGREHNKAGAIPGALKALDLCWTFIDCGKAIAEGIVKGIDESGKAIASVALSSGDTIVESIRNAAHHVIRFVQDHPPAIVVMIERDHGDMRHLTIAEELLRIGDALRRYIHDHPRDALKEGTAFATQSFLTGKAMGALSAFLEESACQLPAYLKEIKETQQLTVEEIPAAIAVKIIEESTGKTASIESLQNYRSPNIPKSTSIKQIHNILKLQTNIAPQQAYKILNESKELKELNQLISNLKNKIADIKYGFFSDRFSDIKTWEKLEQEATHFYDEIKRSTIDIEKISANTGISHEIIKKIKDHIFMEEHILQDNISPFHVDIDMSNAWKRLISGNFVQSDLVLLQHEYAEAIIMNGKSVNYDCAHKIVNEIYNWNNSVRK